MVYRVLNEVQQRLETLRSAMSGSTVSHGDEDELTAKESSQLAYNDLLSALKLLKDNYL